MPEKEGFRLLAEGCGGEFHSLGAATKKTLPHVWTKHVCESGGGQKKGLLKDLKAQVAIMEGYRS